MCVRMCGQATSMYMLEGTIESEEGGGGGDEGEGNLLMLLAYPFISSFCSVSAAGGLTYIVNSVCMCQTSFQVLF